MDESRRQFEEWFKDRFHLGDEHLSEGEYGSDTAQTAWIAWQASRESMKPNGTCVLTVTNSTGEEISISDVIGFEVVEYKGA